MFPSYRKTCLRIVALLDSGSDAMLISENLANKLQLSRITKDIALTNVLSMINKVPSKLVSLHFIAKPSRTAADHKRMGGSRP